MAGTVPPSDRRFLGQWILASAKGAAVGLITGVYATVLLYGMLAASLSNIGWISSVYPRR